MFFVKGLASTMAALARNGTGILRSETGEVRNGTGIFKTAPNLFVLKSNPVPNRRVLLAVGTGKRACPVLSRGKVPVLFRRMSTKTPQMDGRERQNKMPVLFAWSGQTGQRCLSRFLGVAFQGRSFLCRGVGSHSCGHFCRNLQVFGG